MKKSFALFIAVTTLWSCQNQAQETKSNPIEIPMKKETIYQFNVQDLSGNAFDFTSLKGKKIMIVNTASECGLTPQYEQLQAVYEKYKEQNLVIVGFPANNFGSQEPGSNAQIATFCQKNYGVTFLIAQKSDVKGANQNEVYKWLSDKEKNGWNTEVPSWNFGKYLVDEKGNLVSFFPSNVAPMDEKITKNFK